MIQGKSFGLLVADVAVTVIWKEKKKKTHNQTKQQKKPTQKSLYFHCILGNFNIHQKLDVCCNSDQASSFNFPRFSFLVQELLSIPWKYI